jgi:hypothetical protein
MLVFGTANVLIEGLGTIISCCAGLDVHKESVEADVRRIEPNGRLHREPSAGVRKGQFSHLEARLSARSRASW